MKKSRAVVATLTITATIVASLALSSRGLRYASVRIDSEDHAEVVRITQRDGAPGLAPAVAAATADIRFFRKRYDWFPGADEIAVCLDREGREFATVDISSLGILPQRPR